MIPNLFLLTGEDSFRLNERLKLYKKLFYEKYEKGEIESFGEEETFANLENTVLTPNLFGDKRLLICENFWDSEKFEKAQKHNFFEQLTGLKETVSIILVMGSLDKRLKLSKFFLENARIEEFNLLNSNDSLEWIIKFTKKNNGNISRKSAEFLLNRVGGNLWNLSQEIKKLILISEEKEISIQQIRESTIPNPKATIWNFIEDISKKNVRGAMENLEILLKMGQSPYQILPMIQREVRIHSQINIGIEKKLSIKEIASIIKLQPFVVQKTLPLSKHFSRKMLEKMYDFLFMVDKKIKTGGIYTNVSDQSELVIYIETFILKFCSK